MALLPQRLSDGFVELRRCGFVDLESAVDAIHESWSELHHWLVSFQEEVTQDSYVRVIDDYVRGFDEDQDWSYFVVDQDDAALVGVANLYRLSGPERVAIGYWVRTSRTRRGYASRASRLLVDQRVFVLAHGQHRGDTDGRDEPRQRTRCREARVPLRF